MICDIQQYMGKTAEKARKNKPKREPAFLFNLKLVDWKDRAR